MSSPGSLRERKKIATRLALASAAARLADQRGLAQVRIEDIAAEAGVSLRTFRNYFPNKEAAVVGLLAHNTDRLLEALRARPADEQLSEALAQACHVLYREEPDRAWAKRMRFLRTEPALAAEKYRLDAIVLDVLADEIETRSERVAGPPVYPRLAAEVTIAALRAAIDYWIDTPGSIRLKDVVMDFIRRTSPRPGDDGSRSKG